MAGTETAERHLEGGDVIVVGVDGSHPSSEALRWALAEARLRGTRLRVIHAYPELPHLTGSTGSEYYPQVEKEATESLEEALREAGAADGDAAGVSLDASVVPGNAAEVLIEASHGAGLLVVGSRGLGGFRGLVMGSVSMQCVHYAHCPVVVIRDRD